MLRNNILKATLFGLLTTGLAACTESPVETLHSALDSKAHIVLTFVTPNDNASTRSAGTATRATYEDGYEEGIGYEDYVNIEGGDYRVYFFTYDPTTRDAGTLLAEFTPTEITSSSSSSATTYTMTGEVPNELLSESNFRVVMLANWGWWYPSVTVGVTTIDDLCEGQYSTFNAFKKFSIDKDNLIPFYGVQEYEDVTFGDNETVSLDPSLSLLRSVAKVEVILEPGDDQGIEFESVCIVNYNAQGYCAPWGVYKAEDYNADYGIQPEDGEWPNVYARGLHLVSGKNDEDSKRQAFTHINGQGGTAYDTWRIYLPEYDNSGDDYSYIEVQANGEQYTIYFADYTDGKTDNTSRYSLKRNNLYRFYVALTQDTYELDLAVRAWTSILGVEGEVEYTSPITYADDTYCITMLEVTSTFSITPSLLRDGTAVPDVSWTWTYLRKEGDEASFTNEDGVLTMTRLTATPGYEYSFTLVGEWSNGGTTRQSRTFDVKVVLEEGWPVLKRTSRAWRTKSKGSEWIRVNVR